MDSKPRAPNQRIPGTTVLKEIHTKDLTKLTLVELLDIKQREADLLKKKSRLRSLPDKGKRIQDYYDRVVAELERRYNVDEAASLLSELNIASKAKDALNNLEWHGRLDAAESADPSDDVLDSDDETDVLRIIAHRQMHKRILVEKPVTLITANDLAEIKGFNAADSSDSGFGTVSGAASEASNESLESKKEATNIVDAALVEIDVGSKLHKIKEVLAKSPGNVITNTKEPKEEDLKLEQHALYLMEKTEKPSEQREKFKPYQTTISNVHKPENERARKQAKNWEPTAATPPLIQHNGTQLLSLAESVELQGNYLTKLKDLQQKQAEERLMRKLQDLRVLQLPGATELRTKASFQKYRNVDSIEGKRLNEDELLEVHDPLDIERGGVNYTFSE